MRHIVRIIGGLYRGKKIHFPESDGLRPTPDRVKETLFNWLMHDIRDARCLDAFAGSGALGLEAYSRGAKRVVLVESAPLVYNNLKRIVAPFDSTNLLVLNSTAQDFFVKTKEHFDIIFLDPPFSTHYLTQCIDFLSHANLLVNGGLVYIESATKPQLDPTIWRERKLKQAGQVHYGLYEKCA